jgi:XisI protein
MDKLTHYQKAILDFLNRYNAETTGNTLNSAVSRRILADTTNNSFQLLSIGWRDNHYSFGPIFHFDIINGKIWIQCNNTEREVVDELMAAGVEPNDIVLGFLNPKARQFSGFAVA